MRGFIGFTKRNLMLYFKDIQTVIFSLLTSIIVFALYLLFLKGNYVDSIQSAMKGLENIVNGDDIDMLVNGILLTGIMGSALITVPYNCLSVIVKDRESKIDCDISATPMKRSRIILSYIVSSTISAIIMASIILTIGLIILGSMGNTGLTIKAILCLYGFIVLGAISSTTFFILFILAFKTASASGAFFGMLSAASGFVIGAYIPVSEFSTTVQTICNMFPATHITVLIRSFLLTGILDKINTDINGLDNGVFVDTLKEVFVFKTYMFEKEVTPFYSVSYILGIALICIAVMIFLYRKAYKRK